MGESSVQGHIVTFSNSLEGQVFPLGCWLFPGCCFCNGKNEMLQVPEWLQQAAVPETMAGHEGSWVPGRESLGR